MNINFSDLESHTELYWQTFFYRDSISRLLCENYQLVLTYCDGITTPALGPLLSIIISIGGNTYLHLSIGALLVVFLFRIVVVSFNLQLFLYIMFIYIIIDTKISKIFISHSIFSIATSQFLNSIKVFSCCH